MKRPILLVSLTVLIPLASCVYRPYPYYHGSYGGRYYGGDRDHYRDGDRRGYRDRDDYYDRDDGR